MTTVPGRVARTIGWLALAIALALGGSGLIAEVSHPPGDSRREELTYAADAALAPRLDAVAAQLTTLGGLVDQLSGDARSALVAVGADDADMLQTALDAGSGHATLIQSAVASIRGALAGLPGEGPGAAAIYSNATLVRRADILAALDSLAGIGDKWTSVTSQASNAAELTGAIRSHDATVAAAAAQGVKARYTAALNQLTKAAATIDEIAQLRLRIVPGTGPTVLDDWIDRHRAYDDALTDLYKALKASGGTRNPVVDAAYRAENTARAALPADNRAIIVIVSEVAEGGLNQAVVAIEDARGRIDRALAAVSPGQAASG